ncbi:MAG: ABC-2 type transport system ATP-binding protein [Porticoccus sp.]|jgi:ABC-2 type transport system ATP-binding protein
MSARLVIRPETAKIQDLVTGSNLMVAALSISQLEKTYSNGFQALNGIDLQVEEGDFFALLGPNGAGKSTTIGIICSLVNKTGGKVRVFGVDTDEDFSAAKNFIGVVPQEFNFNLFEKVFNIVVTQAGYYGMPLPLAKERAEKYLKQLGLWDKKDEIARTLSGGMKRRLMIARALVHEPKLLILDEPTAGVDIEIRRSMWKFLQKINTAGTTIILTTHYLEEAESLCRNVAIINNGEIVANSSMKALLQKMDKQSFVFDTKTDLPENFTVANYETTVIDPHCFEITLNQGESLNTIVASFTQAGVEVVSMRNKSNRLEELFMTLVEGANNG